MPQAAGLAINRHDYQAMPQGPPYFQLIEGDLIMSPSPTTLHQRIAGRLLSLIHTFLESHPIGEVFMAPLDVFLSDTNVYQPDVMFVSNERRSIITDHGLEGAPDLVIEILSPSTAAHDQGFKRKVYARTGVLELWLIDPLERRIQIYELQSRPDLPSATHGPKAVYSTKLLPGLKFKASDIFMNVPAAR